ncbi:MAG: hypothetical protein EA361_03350 [Bacteroidetes bacterium]|nr:MAG: hypothetical protein EA361_03350 [Bacteroidota bacterium]
MRTNLLKIEKIASGISQLFTAMDKGFAKVESDLTLLTRFRHICYDANNKLETALEQLRRFETISDPEFLDKETAELINYEVSVELMIIKEIVSNNIMMITDYINDYADLWKKTFSLIALQKFRHLLINESKLLNREIELFVMQDIYNKRQEILKKTDTAKISNERY